MQTRQLGNSDLHISRVGYGAWAIGGSGWQFAWGSQDDNDSIAAILRSLELGVHWIDTAAVYGRDCSDAKESRRDRRHRGARNASQADGVMRAVESSLSGEEVSELENVSNQFAA